jgi:hypothetical protein
MAFSATESAFEGFRVVKRSPLVILWWSLAYLLFFAVLLAAIGGPVLSMMPQLRAMEGQDPSTMDFGPIFQLYGLLLAVALPLGVIFGAVLNAAVARSVLFPAAKGFGYMRIGKDELRVAGVTLILTIVFMAIYALLFGVVAVVAVSAYSANAGLGVLLGVMAGLAALAVMAFVAVKFSLAVPIVVAEKRFAVFDSWALTKGRFWPLVGMALIAFVMAIIVNVLGAVIGMPFQLMGGAFSSAVESGNTAAILSAFGPIVVVSIVINLIVSTLQLAVLYAPFSSAYLGIMEERRAAGLTTVPPTA